MKYCSELLKHWDTEIIICILFEIGNKRYLQWGFYVGGNSWPFEVKVGYSEHERSLDRFERMASQMNLFLATACPTSSSFPLFSAGFSCISSVSVAEATSWSLYLLGLHRCKQYGSDTLQEIWQWYCFKLVNARNLGTTCVHNLPNVPLRCTADTCISAKLTMPDILADRALWGRPLQDDHRPVSACMVKGRRSEQWRQPSQKAQKLKVGC